MTTYQTVTGIFNEGPKKVSKPLSVTQLFDPERKDYGETYTTMHTASTPGVSSSRIPSPSIRTKYEDSSTSWKFPKHDPASFSKIRRSGAIKMSDYTVGKREVKHHIITDSVSWVTTGTSGNDESIPHRFGWEGPNYWSYLGKFYVQSKAGYTRHRDARDFSSFPLIRPPDDTRSFNAETQRVMGDVVVAMTKQFDLMTEIFESRNTFGTLVSLIRRVINPLRTLRDLRQKVRSGAATHKEFTERWLELRYGIMPTIYSIQDAMELMDKAKSKYQTVRSRATVDLDFTPKVPPNTNTRYVIRRGELRINGTGKALFRSPNSRLLHQTSFNIATAVWETIPFSLVVDWFINVGDWIHSQTQTVNRMIADQAFCFSVKRTLVEETRVQIFHAKSYHEPGGPSWPSLAFTLPDRVDDHLLTTVEEESYSRHSFKPSDVGLAFNPKFDNWKRQLDAYALSAGVLSRVLRSLR